MMVLRLWLFFGLLAFAGLAQAEGIVVFGDSISAGLGLEVKQGWVTLLATRLQQSAPGKYAVVNASLSGETTSGGLGRLPGVLEKYHPDYLILELGGNDGLRAQSPALMEKNLEEMIRLAHAGKVRVVLLGMKIPPNYGRAYSDAFASVYGRVAKAEKVPLVPFFLDGVGGVPGMMQDDGIHPNTAAQPKLLDNVWPVLSTSLKRHKG